MTVLIAKLKFGPNSQAEMSVHTQTQRCIFYLMLKIIRKMPHEIVILIQLLTIFPVTFLVFRQFSLFSFT